MGCEYAFDSGRSKAIHELHKVINKLLEDNVAVHPSTLKESNEYWRHIGQQDILLKLLGVISEMIVSKY
jgi:hypothetical protein